MLSIAESVKAELEKSGVEPIWLVEMFVGPLAFLRMANYTLAAGDAFTLTVTLDDLSTAARTYTEGTDFDAITSEAQTAQNICDAINADTTINNIVSAYPFVDTVVIWGRAHESRVQASNAALRFSISTAADAWTQSHNPIDKSYKFCTGSSYRISGAETERIIPELVTVGGVSASIHPIDRKFSVGDLEIIIEDQNEGSVAREILYRSFPKGQKVTLKIGTRDVPIGSFVPAGAYLIEDIVPSRGQLSIDCSEITALSRDASADNVFPPVPQIDDIAQTLGSGVAVSIELLANDGTVSTHTFTEGVDWTGDTLDDDFARELCNAINSSAGLKDRVSAIMDTAQITGGAVFVIPRARYDTTPAAWASRPMRIAAYSSRPDVLEIVHTIYPTKGSGAMIPLHATRMGYVGQNPIRAIREILRGQGATSLDVVEATFEKSAHPTVSHTSISVHDDHQAVLGADNIPIGNSEGDTTENPPANAGEVIDLLGSLVQGGIVADESSKISFLRRDTTRAAIRSLVTEDECQDWEWLENYATQRSRCTIYGTALGAAGLATGNERVQCIDAKDKLASALHAFRARMRNDDEPIEHPFLGVWTTLNAAPDADDTTIDVIGAFRCGFAGSKAAMSNDATGTQASDDQISSGRPAYLVMWAPHAGAVEIVRATASTPMPGTYLSDSASHVPPNRIFPSEMAYRVSISDSQPHGSYTAGGWLTTAFNHWRYTIERGTTAIPILGSVGVDFSALTDETEIRIADITLAVEMATHQLSAAYGIPRARFRTTLRHLDLQLGDVITHDNQEYISFLEDGADTTSTWEIVMKEIDFPFVVYEIARLSRRLDPLSVGIIDAVVEFIIPIVTPVFSLGDVVTDNDDVNVSSASGELVTRG